MSNPKDISGQQKVSISYVPTEVLLEAAVAMSEGAIKYGPYNWRDTPVSATVYTDAAWRHISAFMVGEDIDPDSGIHHLTKAITTLMVIRDAIIHNSWVDNRPKGGIQTQPELNEIFKAMLARHTVKQAESESSTLGRFTLGESKYFPDIQRTLRRVHYKGGIRGGWVEDHDCIEHKGSAVVLDEARVLRGSRVIGDAIVRGNSLVSNGSVICDNAVVVDSIINARKVHKDTHVVNSKVVSGPVTEAACSQA